MSTRVVCPNCEAVSYFDELGRDAGAFCRECDYPLFWTSGTRGTVEDDLDQGHGVRRLPGVAGREASAWVACPRCQERNQMQRRVCVRCGADLHPVPVVVVPEPAPVPEPEPEPEPEPVPEPEPEPEPRLWWPVALLASGVVVLVIVFVLIR
jgi:hypothetical protein